MYNFFSISGGGIEIRTLATHNALTVFETAPFDHLGIPPARIIIAKINLKTSLKREI